eukprot:TRINITY_DN2357_c0_g1_i1.p1 TRINITY_DN2357_c0_g1~~TRINITY_DN2357_c0_g1_i1.p1  ORF type:complete len:945 (+),score=124.00 TRINITY_DN2357_c0_g1_i1:33-2867(+)
MWRVRRSGLVTTVNPRNYRSGCTLGTPATVTSCTAYVARRVGSVSATYSTGGFHLTANENRFQNAALLHYINAFREYGHYAADLDPLKMRVKDIGNVLDPAQYGLDKVPKDKRFPLAGLLYCGDDKAEATLPEITEMLKTLYCSTTGIEFTHLETPEEREWFARNYEANALATPTNKKTSASGVAAAALSTTEQKRVMNLLQTAEVFDHFVHTKFASTKRYGLEGCEAMMPCMDTIFATAAKHDVQSAVISMPHRGRLNFLTGMLQYPASNVFSKIQGHSDAPDPSVYKAGTGDVLSHIAQSVDLSYENKKLHVSLIHNPSHLEATNSVAMGKARAKIEDESSNNPKSSLCIMVHGDAAMAAQGVVTETLAMSLLKDYTVGGAVHVVVNNQLGFTAEAHKGRSSWYCTDIGKMVNAPSIHINAEDPEAVVRATRLAMEYRQKFGKDVFIDLVGYRRHGHNEMDEPAFTQPKMYQNIRARKSMPAAYTEKLVQEGVVSAEDVKKTKDELRQHLDSEFNNSKSPRPGVDVFSGKWKGMKEPHDLTAQVKTGVPEATLKKVGLASVDSHGFEAHSRLTRFFMNSRKERIEAGDQLDWATAESLAFGSLLLDGHNVRISGQDVGRGTFSHRHVRLVDQQGKGEVIPLNKIAPKQGTLHVADSLLSEFAVMGFEYGYSLENPNNLCIWEAQFGDFFNGAQIAIDTFITSGEDKWWRESGLTLLLPHGYDGAGPEHSSCRFERFLQNCTGDLHNRHDEQNLKPNMQVAYPTTPANYFHLLRRQMKRDYRKPLVVVAPKIMIRLPEAVSTLKDMTPDTHFQPVLYDDSDADSVTQVLFCTGKIYYELLKDRQKKQINDTAIVRLEELSPFPYAQVEEALDKYRNAREYKWVQEEPQNMGAWTFVYPRFASMLSSNPLPIGYVGRNTAAAPACGLPAMHKAEVAHIFKAAWE